jgi:hypothetical protein
MARQGHLRHALYVFSRVVRIVGSYAHNTHGDLDFTFFYYYICIEQTHKLTNRFHCVLRRQRIQQ